MLFRLYSTLRRRWASTSFVTLIVAVVGAIVIALASGAQRTGSAPDRYSAQAEAGLDALVVQDTQGGPPLTAEVAALPGVESAASASFVFGGFLESTAEQADGSYVFAGSPRPLGLDLVEGRLANPSSEHEFVATRTFVDLHGAAIGDSFELFTYTLQQVRSDGFTGDDPQGPRVTMTLVGILDGPSQLEESAANALVSPALLNDPQVAIALTLIAVDLAPGIDIGMLRAELDTLPDHDGFSVEPGVLISENVRRAVKVQAQGLWLLAAAAAVASIATLGQLIARQVRPAQSERERLAAIGFTDRQMLAESAGFALLPIALGVLLAMGLALIPSGAFPSGFARAIEPNPGIFVDWKVLLGGGALFIVALSLWTMASLTIAQSRTRSKPPSPAVDAIATRIASATCANGTRFALTSGDRGRGSVGGAIAGVSLAIASVVAAITFGVSLDRLVTQPFRYGGNYDFAIGDNGADTLPDGLVERLNANPDVESLTVFAGSKARAGDATVMVLGMDVVRGGGTPYVVDGRLPVGEDEIALGQVTADQVGAHIGEQLALAGSTDNAEFRVTGLVVMPGFGESDGIGEGALVTTDGLARLDVLAQPQQASAQLSIPVTEFVASVPELADLPPFTRFVPPAILNVQRIRAIPFVLAGVLAALALLTAANVLLISIRSRKRDRAILSALGADRGWILRTTHWQATVFALLPVALGVPIGIMTGRLVFSAFASNMGAVSSAAVPLAIVGVGGTMVLLVANLIAALPARSASRLQPARVLRTE